MFTDYVIFLWEYTCIRRQNWCSKEVLGKKRKNELKINKAKTKLLEFRLKNKIRENGSGYIVRLTGQLIHSIKKFKYLGEIKKEREIRCKKIGKFWKIQLVVLDVSGWSDKR